jgi:hypothetical protein
MCLGGSAVGHSIFRKSEYKIAIFLDAGPLEYAYNEESSVEEGVGPLKI